MGWYLLGSAQIYSASQKFCRNRIVLLDKPTVAAGMMRIVGKCVRATGTALAVPVGAGVPAGAKHDRPARRPVTTGNFVDADPHKMPVVTISSSFRDYF